jgi:hypothetical protein
MFEKTKHMCSADEESFCSITEIKNLQNSLEHSGIGSIGSISMPTNSSMSPVITNSVSMNSTNKTHV